MTHLYLHAFQFSFPENPLVLYFKYPTILVLHPPVFPELAPEFQNEDVQF